MLGLNPVKTGYSRLHYKALVIIGATDSMVSKHEVIKIHITDLLPLETNSDVTKLVMISLTEIVIYWEHT